MVNNKYQITNLEYHKTAWLKFTSLTEEEEENLAKILLHLKLAKRITRRRLHIICIETGQVWNNIKECANYFTTCNSAISQAIKYNRAIKRKWHIKYI